MVTYWLILILIEMVWLINKRKVCISMILTSSGLTQSPISIYACNEFCLYQQVEDLISVKITTVKPALSIAEQIYFYW